MTPDALLTEILRLPPEERFKLLSDVWDSIAAEPDAVPVPGWHREELDRRVAEPNPEHLTWEQVQKRIRETE